MRRVFKPSSLRNSATGHKDDAVKLSNTEKIFPNPEQDNEHYRNDETYRGHQDFLSSTRLSVKLIDATKYPKG